MNKKIFDRQFQIFKNKYLRISLYSRTLTIGINNHEIIFLLKPYRNTKRIRYVKWAESE